MPYFRFSSTPNKIFQKTYTQFNLNLGGFFSLFDGRYSNEQCALRGILKSYPHYPQTYSQ